MEISPYELTRLLFYSFVFGMVMGCLHDVNRIIRIFFGIRRTGKIFEKLYEIDMPFRKGKRMLRERKKAGRSIEIIITFLGDILWWLFAAVGIILLNYFFNKGVFRAFTVFGMAVGFVLYYFTLGKLVMMLAEAIVFALKYTFFALCGVLGYPFCIFLRIFLKIFKKAAYLLGNSLEKWRKKMYNIMGRKKMLQKASRAFLDKRLLDNEMKIYSNIKK